MGRVQQVNKLERLLKQGQSVDAMEVRPPPISLSNRLCERGTYKTKPSLRTWRIQDSEGQILASGPAQAGPERRRNGGINPTPEIRNPLNLNPETRTLLNSKSELPSSRDPKPETRNYSNQIRRWR